MKAAIFDFDGTLIDSMDFWKNLGKYYLETKGIEPDELSIKAAEESSFTDAAGYYKKRYGFIESIEEIADEIKACMMKGYESFELKPHAREFLEKLKSRGVKMCIATGTEKSMAESTINRLGLSDYFEFIITCNDVGAWKDNPIIFEESLKSLGTDKKDTYIFEDSPTAAKIATENGFHVVGIFDVFWKEKGFDIKPFCNKFIRDFYDLI